MALPARVYLTLHETSARWGCNIADIAGWADAGRFRILSGIAAVRYGDEVIAGKVTLSPMELMPLFRRCGTGPAEGIMRRIQPAGRQDWLLITDPVCGITVAVADMVIMADRPRSAAPLAWRRCSPANQQRRRERQLSESPNGADGLPGTGTPTRDPEEKGCAGRPSAGGGAGVPPGPAGTRCLGDLARPGGGIDGGPSGGRGGKGIWQTGSDRCYDNAESSGCPCPRAA